MAPVVKKGKKASARTARRTAGAAAEQTGGKNGGKVVGRAAGKPTVRPANKAPTPRARPKAQRDLGDDDGPQRASPMGLPIDDEVLEFIEAIDRFKKEHARPFPTWSEVLHVLRGLGYSRR